MTRLAVIEPEVSLSQLRCFVTAVDEGSLAKAGRQLGMSTASVSKAIVRLEQAAGVKLLHRSTHALSLTQDGEQLIESARSVVHAARVFSRSAGVQNQESAAGWVRITAPVAFMRDVLTPLLARFGLENPSIRFDLRASNGLVDLAKDGVDIAIRSGSLVRVPGHLQTAWFRFPWVVCAAPAYLAGRAWPLQPNDLALHRLIGFRNQRTGQVRPWGFQLPDKDGETLQIAPPDPAAVFDDGGSGWNAAVHGAGIASVPLWLAADDLRAGRVVELMRDWRDAETTMYLLRRDRRLAPERVDTVINYLQRHAPPLTDVCGHR